MARMARLDQNTNLTRVSSFIIKFKMELDFITNLKRVIYLILLADLNIG